MASALLEREARRVEDVVRKPKKSSLKISREIHELADLAATYRKKGINEFCEEILREAAQRIIDEREEEIVARRTGQPGPKRKGSSA